MPAPDPKRALPARRAGKIAHDSIARSTELIVMVRDEGVDAIGEYLDRFNTQDLYGMLVTLAAMVPDDAVIDDLLEWTYQLAENPTPKALPPRPVKVDEDPDQPELELAS